LLALLIEIGTILLFILNIYLAKKTKKLDLLIISTVFAALFENLHVIMFQNYIGGYYYSNEFLLNLYKVPLFVVLSWGIIILNAYLIATKLTNKVARIFLVPLLVVMVDFAFEFFAVKQGYWTWIGYDSTMGLLGIPASNFISWITITWALIFFYEEVREKWIIPAAAYIFFVFMSAGLYFITGFLRIDINQQVYILWMLIILFASITLALWKIKGREDVKQSYLLLATLSRSAFFIFSVILVFTNREFAGGIWPILAYVYLIEFSVTVATYYKKRKINFISSFSS